MENLSFLWDIHYVIITILGYPLSLIELIGTLSGLVSVYLASRANIWTWGTGILNEIAFFVLFYQVSLYSDMLLQVYFFVISVYGWIYWNQNKTQTIEENIQRLSNSIRLRYLSILILGTIALGFLMQDIHTYLPQFFPTPASYPFFDAFTTVASILAIILLASKKIENWVLWIIVDMVAIVLYFLKDIRFVAIEYIIFLILASYGLWSWSKKLKRA